MTSTLYTILAASMQMLTHSPGHLSLQRLHPSQPLKTRCPLRTLTPSPQRSARIHGSLHSLTLSPKHPHFQYIVLCVIKLRISLFVTASCTGESIRQMIEVASSHTTNVALRHLCSFSLRPAMCSRRCLQDIRTSLASILPAWNVHLHSPIYSCLP